MYSSPFHRFFNASMNKNNIFTEKNYSLKFFSMSTSRTSMPPQLF